MRVPTFSCDGRTVRSALAQFGYQRSTGRQCPRWPGHFGGRPSSATVCSASFASPAESGTGRVLLRGPETATCATGGSLSRSFGSDAGPPACRRASPSVRPHIRSSLRQRAPHRPLMPAGSVYSTWIGPRLQTSDARHLSTLRRLGWPGAAIAAITQLRYARATRKLPGGPENQKPVFVEIRCRPREFLRPRPGRSTRPRTLSTLSSA